MSPAQGPATPPTAAAAPDPAIDLWETHFQDPATAMARAEAVLADADAELRSVAWAELTVAFHHLFFTARPVEAGAWLPRAEQHFATLGERRGDHPSRGRVLTRGNGVPRLAESGSYEEERL